MSYLAPLVLTPAGALGQMSATDNVPLNNLGTGTPTVGTFLCGDGTWSGVSLSLTVRSVSATGPIDLGDGVVLASNTITLTLPDAATAVNKKYEIKNAGTGVITIVPFSNGQTIDGDTSLVIQYQYSAVGLVSNGSTWSMF